MRTKKFSNAVVDVGLDFHVGVSVLDIYVAL